MAVAPTPVAWLAHLRGSALGFRNLTDYTARRLLQTGGLRPRIRLRSGRALVTWRRLKRSGIIERRQAD